MGYTPIYMLVTGSLQKLCVSHMPSLSGTQMFNVNGKFANIVVWQREPLCAAVSRFGGRYKDIAPPVGSETKFDGFVRDILHPKAQTPNMALFPQSQGEPWGRKLCRLKRRGRKASPARLTSARNAGWKAISNGVGFHALGLL